MVTVTVRAPLPQSLPDGVVGIKYAVGKPDSDLADAADFDNTGIARTQTGCFAEIVEDGCGWDPDSAHPFSDSAGLGDVRDGMAISAAMTWR